MGSVTIGDRLRAAWLAARNVKFAHTDGFKTWYLGGGNNRDGMGKTYESVAKSGYATNADVYAVISLLSASAAAIPWIVRKRTKGVPRRDWEVISDHDFYDLWEEPNPLQSQSDFIDALVGSLYIGGESFVKLAGPTVGAPREMWLLRPDHTKVIAGNRYEPVSRYEYKPDPAQAAEIYRPEEIGHIKFWNPLDPLRGMSPLVAAANGIDQGNEGRSWNISLLRKGASPSAIAVYGGNDGDITPEQAQQLESKINDKWSGSRSAGSVIVTGGLLDWRQIGLSPSDMSWGESLKISMQDVCKVCRVPSIMVGDTTASTYSNYEQAQKSLYHEGVLPLVDRIRDAFNRFLIPRFGDSLWLDYDITAIDALQENENERFARIEAATVLTLNEKRKALGYDRLDQGDVLMLNPGVIPVPPGDLGAYGGGIDYTPITEDDGDSDAA